MFDYFFAVQVGQVAQVALASAQHFMPQDALSQDALAAESFLQQEEDAQPLMMDTAQTSATNVTMDFMSSV